MSKQMNTFLWLLKTNLIDSLINTNLKFKKNSNPTYPKLLKIKVYIPIPQSKIKKGTEKEKYNLALVRNLNVMGSYGLRRWD